MLIRRSLFALSLVALAGVSSLRADDGDTFLDPKNAGPDYAVQGEYAGETVDGQRIACQVIALGGGKFDIVGYQGGLPGDGWRRGGETVRGTATLADGKVTAVVANTRGTLDGDTVKVVTETGELHATLKRVERKSPTLGAKPPEGAIVLFDGSNADEFNNGHVVDGLLQADCDTKRKFGDHTLHIEFRTPFKPTARGQARGNSGVYIQSRYELQVLDSFGLDGKNNECGGIYSISEPAVNMCFPPLTWQTYDIDFKQAKYDDQGKKVANARVTIRHNGVVIHDNLELTQGTPGRHPEGPGKDGLYLQGHGNPVVYRNIWVVEK